MSRFVPCLDVACCVSCIACRGVSDICACRRVSCRRVSRVARVACWHVLAAPRVGWQWQIFENLICSLSWQTNGPTLACCACQGAPFVSQRVVLCVSRVARVACRACQVFSACRGVSCSAVASEVPCRAVSLVMACCEMPAVPCPKIACWRVVPCLEHL